MSQNNNKYKLLNSLQNNQISLIEKLDLEKDGKIVKSFYKKDTLSSDIFDLVDGSYKMKEGIRENLIKISNAFLDFIEVDFFVHDIFIHQRFKFLRNTNNNYFRAIRRAHKMHHKHLSKEHGECFGMLWVPFKYFRKTNLLLD